MDIDIFDYFKKASIESLFRLDFSDSAEGIYDEGDARGLSYEEMVLDFFDEWADFHIPTIIRYDMFEDFLSDRVFSGFDNVSPEEYEKGFNMLTPELVKELSELMRDKLRQEVVSSRFYVEVLSEIEYSY